MFKLKINFFCIVFIFGFLVARQSNGQKSEFEARAGLLIDYIADFYPRFNNGKTPPGGRGDLSDFGKYNYPKIIAVFEKYGTDAPESALYNQRMKIYSSKPTFHFNLVGLPRILLGYPDAPSVREYEENFLRRVFERNDSYNAWTCEGTENHISMSRTSGYLYAQIALKNHLEAFPKAGLRLDQMRRWIRYFSERIFRTGTGEFNSAIYEPYNIIGWLNLYDFAHDEEVRRMARAVLDYYACETALHYSQGMTGGSDLRGKRCTESFKGAAAYLGWLWFGDSPQPLDKSNLNQGDNCNNALIQAVHAATSSYRVPELALKLAKGKLTHPAMYYNSKPGYLLEKPSSIKQTFYRTKNYSLGAGYFPYGGWSAGDHQIVSWKLISRVTKGKNKTAQYVSGIGMENPAGKHYCHGNQRSPFDQLIHHENTLIQLTRVPENSEDIKATIQKIYNDWQSKWKRDFYKRFPNDTDRMMPVHFQDLDVSVNRSSIIFRNAGHLVSQVRQNILFVELEKTWLAIRSVRNDRPSVLKYSENKEYRYTSVEAPKGSVCGMILEASLKSEYTDFQAYQEAVLQKTKLKNEELEVHNAVTYTGLNGDTIKCRYNVSGSFYEPLFDWGYGPTEPMVIHTSPPFIQPKWPKGKGHGKIASWWVNGKEVRTDQPWPVYDGPRLFIGEGRLELTAGEQMYEIDYTGDLPVFNNH
jgi:hypothetical protein